MQRQLCQILTSSTLIDESFLSTQDANNLLAIVELSPTSGGAGNASTATTATTATATATTSNRMIEFGICIVDCTIGEFRVLFLSDDNRRMQLQTVLIQSAPREVIYYRSALSKATLHMINRCIKGRV